MADIPSERVQRLYSTAEPEVPENTDPFLEVDGECGHKARLDLRCPDCGKFTGSGDLQVQLAFALVALQARLVALQDRVEALERPMRERH